MSVATTAKLNIEFPEATEFTLCPLAFFGKHEEGAFNPFTLYNGKAMPRGMTKILSCLWTGINNFGKKTKFSKASISRKCGLSDGAVRYGLNYLIGNKIIEDKGNGVYKIIPKLPKVKGKKYIVLENYLHSKKFDISGEYKKLTQTAVTVLEYIISFYRESKTDEVTGEVKYKNYDFKNRKIINYFQGSEKSIATALNLPSSTVSYAIKELMRAGILSRNKRLRYKDDNDHYIYKIVQERGVTGNTLSLFAVKYEALAVEQRSTYKPQEIEFVEDIEEISVTQEEIEAKYAEFRAEALNKAKECRDNVLSDSEAKEAREELMNADSRTALDKAAARWKKRLAELGIDEEQLNPQYHCSLCEDTGQILDSGQRCCCRIKVRQMIIDSKIKA